MDLFPVVADHAGIVWISADCCAECGKSVMRAMTPGDGLREQVERGVFFHVDVALTR